MCKVDGPGCQSGSQDEHLEGPYAPLRSICRCHHAPGLDGADADYRGERARGESGGWVCRDPADEATVNAVLETVQQLGACINAGDFWGRFAAVFTEDYFRREFETFGPIPESERAFMAATPEPLPAEARVALLAVVDVRTLPDGRVAALIDVQDPFAEPPGPSRFYWEFVQEDGRWLIDEQIMLGPIEPDQVGTPTA
jgi:hypothetical protein